MRLGEEAGLAREALERALTDMRRGTPIEPEEQGALTKTLGASRVIVTRVVGAPIETVRRAVDKFLREQLMTVRRHPRRSGRVGAGAGDLAGAGALAGLLEKRYAFALVNRVETDFSPRRGPSAVKLPRSPSNIDLSEMRRERFGQMRAPAGRDGLSVVRRGRRADGAGLGGL